MKLELNKEYRTVGGEKITLVGLVPCKFKEKGRSAYYLAIIEKENGAILSTMLTEQGEHLKDKNKSINLDKRIKLFSMILNKEITMPWFSIEDWKLAGKPKEVYCLRSNLEFYCDTCFDPDCYPLNMGSLTLGVHSDSDVVKDWAKHLKGYIDLAKGK